ncbi:MAG: helix-turn-helix transcriptional regulator, partial [Tannerellaceae bacterium]
MWQYVFGEDTMTFFERLKKIRLNRGLTQKQVAIGVHITEQSYQRYERGATRPGLDILIALADYFNVSIDYLVGRGFFADWDRIWEHKDDIVK